jgi:hypothetical protein
VSPKLKSPVSNGICRHFLQDKLFGKKSEDEMKQLVEEFKEAVKKEGLIIPGKNNIQNYRNILESLFRSKRQITMYTSLRL